MSATAALRGASVLVMGDVMLDEYVWGEVGRISPEAPVPVVEVTRRSHVPGGAANVAAGVLALDGTASVCGIVGDDAAGADLREALVGADVDVSGLLVAADRPTTAKTRVVAHAQQVVRIDSERRTAVEGEVARRLVAETSARIAEVDAVVVSDYGKGVVCDRTAPEIIAAARAAGRPVVVDPKGLDFNKYRGATLITPNELEFTRAAHVDPDDEAAILRAAREMARTLEVGLLITRGAKGMTLVGGSAELTVAARARDVYDVTGAGDTVVATLAVACGRGLGLADAVDLANEAAGISVGKIGTSTVSWSEIDERLSDRPR